MSANEPVASFSVVMRSAGKAVSGSQASNYAIVNGVVNVTNLLEGSITLQISGVDLAGNADPVPTLITIVVMSTLPAVVVTQPPPQLTNARVVYCAVSSPDSIAGLLSHFAVSATPAIPALPPAINATLNGVAVLALTFPITVNVSGQYTVVVQAVDVLDGAGATASFTVVFDLDPPSSHFTSPLPPYVNSSVVDVAVAAADALSSVTTQLRTGDGAWGSAEEFPALADGSHVFQVRALDGAGNVQPPPYDTVSTIVDTVAPSATLVSGSSGTSASSSAGGAIPQFTHISSQVVCVLTVDASPVTVALTVDGVAVAVGADNCAVVTTPAPGNHSVVATAVDAAGNAATPAVAWFVVDAAAPDHSVYQPSHVGCGVQDNVTSCRLPASALFNVACEEPSVSYTTSPCRLQWVLQSFTSAATCSQGGAGPSESAWITQSSSQLQLDLVAQVAACVAVNPVARFVLYTRAFDTAGNVGADSVVEWWVDTVQPQPPVIETAPELITVDPHAVLNFKLTGDLSPGRVSFTYLLTADGVAVSRPGGNPVVPQPTPSNNDAVTLSLPDLAPNHAYRIEITSVSQSGVQSVPAVVTWQLLSSAPSVLVPVRPDAISGSDRPKFQFVANWGDSQVSQSQANIRFQVMLLGDPGMTD